MLGLAAASPLILALGRLGFDIDMRRIPPDETGLQESWRIDRTDEEPPKSQILVLTERIKIIPLRS